MSGSGVSRIESAFLRAVRTYTFNTPIAKGKYRLQSMAVDLCRKLPERVEARAKDGRKFYANLASGLENSLYFLGEYETVLTEKASSLLREGDICIDVGANFGWYTSLFHKHVGARGAVHAFEPVPTIYDQLARNYELWDSPSSVVLNDIALGDHDGEITINLFPGLTSGHASISSRGRDDAVPFQCRMTTLDSYLVEKNVRAVNFVKVDIEGAELMFLKGATSLFRQQVPPIFLMEMALQQTSNFGYEPNDLIAFFNKHADYNFFAIDEYTGAAQKIAEFPAGHIGANVFCVPASINLPSGFVI